MLPFSDNEILLLNVRDIAESLGLVEILFMLQVGGVGEDDGVGSSSMKLFCATT